MTPEQFDLAQLLFLECRVLAPEQARAIIEGNAAGDETVKSAVLDMLRHDSRDDSLFGSPAMGPGFSLADLTDPARAEGRRIGQYTILRTIGRGGQGVVYEAEQERPRRKVALKLVAPGRDSEGFLKRLEREAEVLAKLRHPGIAQVYEAGTVRAPDGSMQPFFAMELVEGKPLPEFCSSRSLSARDRLALFAKVCEAVQYAHQQGVIHRDLKPDNIFVDESGQPKVLDFGVARIVGDEERGDATRQTAVGQIIGTLTYMSPEQAAGTPDEIDTRSDVYALGVICYELLAGRPPHDVAKRALDEAVRLIREERPRSLATVDRAFRGDVENIVGKALEKEKPRRYQSAQELGADIQRYLEDQPVTARAPTAMYQIGKMAKRNKTLALVIAASVAAIVSLSVVATAQAVRARRAEAVSQLAKAAEQKQRRAAELTNTFLKNVMGAAALKYGDKSATARQALEVAAAEASRGGGTEPLVQAGVHEAVALGYAKLEDWPKARAAIAEALRLYRSAEGVPPGVIASAEWDEALMRYSSGEEAALNGMQAALTAVVAADGDADQKNWERMASLAALLGWNQRKAEGVQWLSRLEAALAAAGDPPDSRYAGQTLLAKAQLSDTAPEKVEHFRRAIGVFESALGGDHPETVEARWLWAFELSYGVQDYAAAAAAYEEVLASARRVFTSPHLAIADCLKELASCLCLLNDAARAEAAAAEALTMYRELGAECDLHRSADILNGLGEMHRRNGREEKAQEKIRLRDEIQARCAAIKKDQEP